MEAMAVAGTAFNTITTAVSNVAQFTPQGGLMRNATNIINTATDIASAVGLIDNAVAGAGGGASGAVQQGIAKGKGKGNWKKGKGKKHP